LVKGIRDKSKPLPSKLDLERLYVKGKKSLREIGKMYSIRPTEIKNILIKYEIKINPRGQVTGVKRSEKTKRKIAESHIGIKCTEESKEKISKANKGRKRSEKTKKQMSISKMGKNNSFYGKTHSKEFKERMSEFGKNRIFSKEHKVNLSKARINVPFSSTKDTKPEKILQNILHQNKIEFVTHKTILGRPDVFINPHFCIFVDGDRYHANPKKYSEETIIWKEYTRTGGRKIPSRTAKMIQEKDKRVNKKLKEEGYQVLRFWESELYENPEKCLKSIQEFIMT
jgi:DNA mismatch endonuclease, patch repair protein